MARAGEKEMNRALARWHQQVAEYQAALKYAENDARRAEIPPPSPHDIAPALWKAVSATTGTREEQTTPTIRKKGQRPAAQTRKVKTYEFDQEWAAPAVVWFINYPEAFAKLFENDAANMSVYADALLNSMLRVHYINPIVADACPKLAESTSDKVREIVEKIYNNNASANARACAALTLSTMLANPTLAAAEGGAGPARSKRIYYIKQALNIASGDTMYGAQTLTNAAEEQIYRLRNLSLGTIPPQIKVITQGGQTTVFPIPGKPNLIFFWSSTEDVGLSIMSKQQALTEQYPELVLCPIVANGNHEEWLRMLSSNGIRTCYMDDSKGSAGLLYRVSMLPMVVLLNERARIVYIGYPDMQLQAALDNLFNAKDKTTPQPQPAARPSAAPPLRPLPQL